MPDPDTRSQAAAPSLFATAQRPTGPTPDAADPLRMLSGLDSNFDSATASSPRTRPWIFGAAAVLLAGAAFSVWQSTRATHAVPPVPSVRAAEPAPLTTATVPAIATLQPASAATAEPARIETAVLPPAAKTAAAVEALPSAPAVEPPRVVANRAASTPKWARSPNVTPAMASHAAGADSNKPTASVKAKPAARSNRGTDSDVELLEAMVAHLQGQDRAPGTGAPTADTRPQTIARLVQDCKQLGPEQLRLCRQQICEGYWGRAQACPVELDPLRPGVPAKAR